MVDMSICAETAMLRRLWRGRTENVVRFLRWSNMFYRDSRFDTHESMKVERNYNADYVDPSPVEIFHKIRFRDFSIGERDSTCWFRLTRF